jgi:hypothetical protein
MSLVISPHVISSEVRNLPKESNIQDFAFEAFITSSDPTLSQSQYAQS